MKKRMKRKQFHMTVEDEEALKRLSESKGLSEAEIVREAFRDYAAKHLKKENPLLKMAEYAKHDAIDSPHDLSARHDYYLQEIHEDEQK